MATPVLPRWEELNGRACYGLAAAKELKSFEVECKSCFATLKLYPYPELALELRAIEQLLRDCRGLGEKREALIGELSALSESQSVTIGSQQAALEESHAYSVFGGALPWVMASLVAAFSAGLALGYSK